MSVTNILNKSARARRLFNAVDCKCLNVAIDHGIFNEGRFLPGFHIVTCSTPSALAMSSSAQAGTVPLTHALAGIEDMPTVLKTLCAANPGELRCWQRALCAMARTDIAYGLARCNPAYHWPGARALSGSNRCR
eukprot:3469766-Rhodomonas_salina.1